MPVCIVVTPNKLREVTVINLPRAEEKLRAYMKDATPPMKTDPSVSLREGSLMVAIAVTEGSCLFVEEKRYRSLVGEGVRVYQLSESRNDK